MKMFKSRVKNDGGAANSVEIIIFIVLAVFLVLAIYMGVMGPMSETSRGLSGIIDSFPVTYPSGP